MGKASSREPAPPERCLDHLGRRLNRHRLWNCLLAVFPPLLLLAYTVAVLFLFNWVGFGVLFFSTAALVGVGLAVVLHFKTILPENEKLGQLIDQRVDGKEHFRTLATIDPARARPSVLAELRVQATRLLQRVNLKRDFPYRIKRGSVWSLVLSVLAIVMIHMLLANPVLSVPDAAALKQVPALAQQFARASGLHGLAERAGHAVGQLQQKLAGTRMVKKMLEQLKTRLGSGAQGGSQGSNSQEQGTTNKSGPGQGSRAQQNAAGTQPGPGQGREPGESGRKPGQDEGDPRQSSDRGDRGTRNENKPGGAKERDDPGGADPKDGRPKDRAKRSKGRAGSGPPSEDIPEGKEPDRFYPPGEEGERIRGGRFVTVALPKALTSGGGELVGAGKQRAASKLPVPVSNVPLPPRADPETAGEKQHMPREYKGLIR